MAIVALMRLGDDAYGVPIFRGIELQRSRQVAFGSVYAALKRLNREVALDRAVRYEYSPRLDGEANVCLRVRASLFR